MIVKGYQHFCAVSFAFLLLSSIHLFPSSLVVMYPFCLSVCQSWFLCVSVCVCLFVFSVCVFCVCLMFLCVSLCVYLSVCVYIPFTVCICVICLCASKFVCLSLSVYQPLSLSATVSRLLCCSLSVSVTGSVPLSVILYAAVCHFMSHSLSVWPSILVGFKFVLLFLFLCMIVYFSLSLSSYVSTCDCFPACGYVVICDICDKRIQGIRYKCG